MSIKAKLNRVVRQWMDEELEKTEEAWAGNGAVDLDDVDDYKDIHYDQLEQAVESLQQNQQWEVKGLADELVSQHSLPVEKGSSDYGRLCRELLRAKVELLQEEIRRLDGDFQPRPAVAAPSAISSLPSVPVVAPVVLLLARRLKPTCQNTPIVELRGPSKRTFGTFSTMPSSLTMTLSLR